MMLFRDFPKTLVFGARVTIGIGVLSTAAQKCRCGFDDSVEISIGCEVKRTQFDSIDPI